MPDYEWSMYEYIFETIKNYFNLSLFSRAMRIFKFRSKIIISLKITFFCLFRLYPLAFGVFLACNRQQQTPNLPGSCLLPWEFMIGLLTFDLLHTALMESPHVTVLEQKGRDIYRTSSYFTSLCLYG